MSKCHTKGTREYYFHGFKSRNRQTGVKIELTFSEWCFIWDNSGMYEQKGWRPMQYCMARIDVDQHWYSGNIQIITNAFRNARTRK